MKNAGLPRRLAALMLALACIMCLCVPAYAGDAEEAEELPPWFKKAPEGDYHGKTVILITGDTSFCDISGYAIISVGSEFANVDVVVIENESKKLEDRWLIPSENLGSNEAVAEAVAQVDASFNVEYGTVFVLLPGWGGRTRRAHQGDQSGRSAR